MNTARLLKQSICLFSIVSCTASIVFLEAPSHLTRTAISGSDAVTVAPVTTTIGSGASSAFQLREAASADEATVGAPRSSQREMIGTHESARDESPSAAKYDGEPHDSFKADFIAQRPALGRNSGSLAKVSYEASEVFEKSNTAPGSARSLQTTTSLPQMSSSPQRPHPTEVLNTGNPALIPAVLAPSGPDTPLTQLQAADRQKIEEDFVHDIEGGQVNPDDPDYRARWQTAQEISDTRFRQKFGTVAFLKYNAEAGRLRNSQ